MRGYPEFNFPAFMAKTAELRAQGHWVFNPAERDVEKGFDPTGLTGSMEELADHDFDLRAALAADTEFICKEATHIWMLPGWSRSTGATAERALAIALGLVVEGAPA
jgi:hypothetical protein